MLKELKDIEFTKDDWTNQKTLDVLRTHVTEAPTPALQNFLLFFEELGEDFSNLATAPMSNENWQEMKKYIRKKSCHKNASFAYWYSEGFPFHYGFMDAVTMDYNGPIYEGTLQHSFNLATISEKGERAIFDTSLSAANRRSGDELLYTGRNYFGVHIPFEILDMIIKANSHVSKGSIINISHYFKEMVFPSKEETTRLIGLIRKQVAT